MKRLWPLIALGVGAFVILASVTFPASIVLSRLGAGITASGVSGSIWNGQAQVLQIQGINVGSVEWDLHVLPLFTLHLNADVKVSRVDGFAATAVSIGPGGKVTLKGLTASLPLSAINSPQLAGWAAQLNAKFARVTLENGWPTEVDGTLDALDVTGPPRRPANVGSYRVVFDPAASSAELLQGAIADAGNGPLLINGTVRLKADRTYEVDALVGTKPNTPQNLARALEFLGPPDPQGRRQFSMAGAL